MFGVPEEEEPPEEPLTEAAKEAAGLLQEPPPVQPPRASGAASGVKTTPRPGATPGAASGATPGAASGVETTPRPGRRRARVKTTPIKVPELPTLVSDNLATTERNVQGAAFTSGSSQTLDKRSLAEKVADRQRVYHKVRAYYYACYDRTCVKKGITGGTQIRDYIQAQFSNLKAAQKEVWFTKTWKNAILTEQDAVAFENWHKFRGVQDKGKSKAQLKNKWQVQKVMLCYHDDDWVLARREWNLSGVDLKDVLPRLRQDPQYRKIFALVEKGTTRLIDTYNVTRWTFSLEVCPKRFMEDSALRVHAHVVLEFQNKHTWNVSPYKMDGIMPAHTVVPEQAHNKSAAKASAPMHYYLQMPKVGLVEFRTNTEAYIDFKVNPRWITGYLQSKRLAADDAQMEYVKCCHNLVGNLNNLKTLTQHHEQEIRSAKKRIIHEALQGQLCTFRAVPQKEVFLAQLATIKSRYKFLVACGPSGTGKTIWGKWLLGDPSLCLEVNCASCPEPDLRTLTARHRLILYDEASCEMVLKQKKLFQGPPDDVLLGCSTTNCHSYSVFVSGVGMIICSNTWFAELRALERDEDRAWLNANSICLHVTSPLWVE